MSKNIDGIKIGDTEIRVLQYADDTTLTVSNNSSIVHAHQIIHDFTVYSGLKLNIEKCEGLWLGTLRSNPKSFHQIKFNTETIKILGVYVGTSAYKYVVKSAYKKTGIQNSNYFRTYCLSGNQEKSQFWERQ